MKKINKIITLILLLIFLTTYNPSKILFFEDEKFFFFQIENIEVINNKKIKKNEVTRRLKHIYKQNILLVSVNDIEKPLKNLNFLDKIEVKKKYPNTVLIKIFETRPVGIIFKDNEKYIIDSSSNLMNYSDNLVYDNLPNVFGKDSEKDFINFFNQLKNNNFPKKRIKNYYYFQINRWDIEMENKQLIKFPSTKRDLAIKQSVELLNRKDFNDYKVIDLRIHGKIVVE